jgi:hypothetical protein
LKLSALYHVTDLTPLLKLPIRELQLSSLGSKAVPSQLLLQMPFLKEVHIDFLSEDQKQEVAELLNQKPDFKIYHDGKLLNP